MVQGSNGAMAQGEQGSSRHIEHSRERSRTWGWRRCRSCTHEWMGGFSQSVLGVTREWHREWEHTL